MTLQSLLNPGIRAVLVKGEPGTGKTLFAFELLRLYGKGVYVSTRVSEEKALDQYPGASAMFKRGKLALANPKAKGAKFEDVRLGNLAIVIDSILDSTSKLREPLVVLDSWDAIAKEAGDAERARAEKTLLALADAKKFRLLFISEEPALATTDYMVDAIVLLKDELFDGMRVRRIEWKKLRGMEIPQESSLFSLFDARFNLFQPLNAARLDNGFEAKPFQAIKNTGEYYSTGSKDLDALLGGGLKKGVRLALELGRYVAPGVHNSLMISMACSFIANGGCYMCIPSAGVTPEMVKEATQPHLPKQIVESGMRVGHFGDARSNDPCFFLLDPASLPKTFETFLSVQEKLAKVGERRRPVLATIGVDTAEMAFGQDIERYLGRGAAMTRHYGDTSALIVKHSTKSKEVLADVVDVYLKLDVIDGALVLYSLKPPSGIFHVKYDYSHGYPSVRLTPVV